MSSQLVKLQELRRVVRDAVLDFVLHGYDSQGKLDTWLQAIERAALAAAIGPERAREYARNYLVNVYSRQVGGAALPVRRAAGGVPVWIVERVRPQLRQELDRRIAASASLIRLNQADAVATTLRRFSGWSTSIPAGGTMQADKREEGQRIVKPLASLDFVARRVAIDQGHKLIAAVNDLVAVDSGAIAAVWSSRWRQAGYNYREDHKELDGLVMLVPDSWAVRQGLVRPGKGGWTTDHPMPAQEVYCRCSYKYVRSLSRLPEDMLTDKGRAALASGRRAVVAV